MSWGCKQKPDGCGWATRTNIPALGQQEWWCDLCERSGEVAIVMEKPGLECPYTGRERHDCHLGPCDCFDDIGCDRCAALPPWTDPAPGQTGEELIAALVPRSQQPPDQPVTAQLPASGDLGGNP